MKQYNLFGKKKDNDNKKYTSNIHTPIYEPRNKKPHILELCDKSKYLRLIKEIDNSNISIEDKQFLLDAAKRHIVFNYEKIADYYAHSSKEVQHLMEKSALVIIDFEKAIELGYVELSNEIRKQYLEEYDQ